MRLKHLYKILSTLLLVVICGVGNVQAALLDAGPVVEQAINSTEATFGKGDPPLGHGYPRWYRDTNRVPLELCLDRTGGQCTTFEPNTAAPLNFPNNFSDEAFWWSAAATIDSGTISALLDMAVEAAYSTGNVVPGAQISFTRVRIRVSGLPEPGEYTVTTPYKQYHFTVVTDPKNGNEINATEDIGVAEGGVFTGALAGTVGPFLYCAGAPYSIAGGLYLAPSGGICTGAALGGTYPDSNQSAYEFRVQGPGGVNISTGQFSIIGKIFTDPIPTPLAVSKSSYARGPAGMQVNIFAKTQPFSNQVNGLAAFPGNFALTGMPSILEASGTDLPNLTLDTNNPADGLFFKASGVFAGPASLPATISVTNTADSPPTVKTTPLVDEVVINNASFSPQNGTLTIAATSLDRVANPALQAFMPGMTEPLGALVNGNLIVPFPFTDNTVVPSRTYNIPPATITVRSAIGGEASAAVATFLSTSTAATGVDLMSNPAGSQISGGQVTFTAQATGGDAGPYEYRYLWRSAAGAFTEGRPYGDATWVWDTTALPVGVYYIQVYARHIGANGAPDAVNMISLNLVGATEVLNGVCGSSSGQILPTAPTTNLCAVGTPTAVIGSGPWSWTCSGQNGGTEPVCSALFQTYTVTFVAGGNGTISGTTPQTVFHNNSATPVTAIPNAGFFFGNWTDAAQVVISGSPSLTLSNVTSDMTLTANFIPTYSINLARCMSGPTPVGQGAMPGYTFDAAGFDIAATVNGTPIVVANSSYTFTDGITTNQTFSATYTINPVGTTAPARLVRADSSFTEHATLQAAYDAAATGDTIMLKAGTMAGNFSANKNISVTIKGGYEATFARNCGTTRINGVTSLPLGKVIFEQIRF